MKSSRRKKRFPFGALITAAVLIAAVILILERIDRVPDKSSVREIRETPSRKAVPQEKETTPPLPETRPPEAERREQQIAIIIDDIGFDLRSVSQLARIESPIAFAVLPHTPHAAEAARILHAAGKEILLHLPMEPLSYPAENPGTGALFVNMDDEEIRSRIESALAAIPYVSGVNNHMGSRFMKNEAKLLVVMEVLSKRGLFFVDSRTTSGSRGREAAATAGVRFAARAVFIDHSRGYEAALSNLTHFPQQGKNQGRPLLMIGHPHSDTVRALKEALSIRQEGGGMRVIPVTDCLDMNGRGKEKYATGRKS